MLLQHYNKGATVTFGETVRERRKELRLGLREFAQRAGMDPGNLSKIERGRLAPPQGQDLLIRLASALEWQQGTPEAIALADLAAVENGQLPVDVLGDEAVMAKIPILLRTVQNKQLPPEKLDELIEMIRDA